MRSTIVVLASLAMAVLSPRPASACGGCFNPPSGMPTPVTGHRMAVSISTAGTTLWDQIQYAGSPEDFVWVLPVMGTPMVELADNAFFEALADATAITMSAPAPPRTFCPRSGGSSFGCTQYSPSAALDGGSAHDGSSVVVHSEGIVGPYETATVGSTDPMELVDWLQDHGYLVPDAILPTIAHYVEMGANFTVLRLAPDAGVDRMQPVRVTSPGLSLSFPLRMVAAGVQTSVELELFVFAESRMEAANYHNAEVDRGAVSYDWASGRFSYDDEYSNALFAGEGPGTNWVTEYAGYAPVPSLASYTSTGPDGEVRTASDDVEVAARGIAFPYLTRMRTELPPSELDRDLLLRASEGDDIGTFFTVTRELNRAPDVSCDSTVDCSVMRAQRDDVIFAVFGLVPLALVWRRRARAA